MIQYRTNVSLRPYNTSGVDVNASHLFYLRHPCELNELLDFPGFNEMSDNLDKILVLGQGSNILFTDDFEGVVIKNEIDGIKIVEEDDASVILEVGAGVIWNDLVEYAVSRNWWGIENLTLIPGTTGAASVQNIGAYGVEVADVVIRISAFHLEMREWLTFENRHCEFGYRESVFKRKLRNKVVICSVVIRLSKRAVPMLEYRGITDEIERRGITEPSVREISGIIASIRRSKLPDPATLGNAGSFFKNPVVSESDFKRLTVAYPQIAAHKQGDLYKIPAGWLIEQAGWKGYRTGNTGCYEKQALILVNYGKATGREILELSEKIIESVNSMFGIILEREVNVIP